MSVRWGHDYYGELRVVDVHVGHIRQKLGEHHFPRCSDRSPEPRCTGGFPGCVIASLFVTRQVVAPVRAMMVASQRIAAGHYDERVRVTSDVSKGELDELAQLALSFNQMAARLEHTEDIRRQLIGWVSIYL